MKVEAEMKEITKVPAKAEQGMAGIGRRQGKSPRPNETAFDRELQAAEHGVKFSRHAAKRIEMRGVELSDSDMNRLNNAVERMAEKGVRDALIWMKQTALVVSVKNRTVITAVDEESAKENIFTNIDSAAIL